MSCKESSRQLKALSMLSPNLRRRLSLKANKRRLRKTLTTMRVTTPPIKTEQVTGEMNLKVPRKLNLRSWTTLRSLSRMLTKERTSLVRHRSYWLTLTRDGP